MATSDRAFGRGAFDTRRARQVPGGEGPAVRGSRMSDRPSRPAGNWSREKLVSSGSNAHLCWSWRHTHAPARSLLSRLPGARTARTVRPSRRMSVDANAEPQPPAKMARLEEALRVKKISEHAILPVRGSDGAAGYDLAAYDCGTSPPPPCPAAGRYPTSNPRRTRRVAIFQNVAGRSPRPEWRAAATIRDLDHSLSPAATVPHSRSRAR